MTLATLMGVGQLADHSNAAVQMAGLRWLNTPASDPQLKQAPNNRLHADDPGQQLVPPQRAVRMVALPLLPPKGGSRSRARNWGTPSGGTFKGTTVDAPKSQTLKG